MNKCVIIVEGIADAVFLNDIIHSILPENEIRFDRIDLFQRGKKVQINVTYDLNILIAGGCTSIKKYNKQIEGFNDEGYKVIMIQDADSEVKDSHHGGVSKRIVYLEEIKKECKIEFVTFLFPDNIQDGTLETILLCIADEELYSAFFDCYSKYSNCIERISDINSKELLEDKYLVYNYCQVYQGSVKSSERDRNYDSNYWVIKHSALEPLLSFLSNEIGI